MVYKVYNGDTATGEPGYAIHKSTDSDGYPLFEIYADDGRGNGDYITGTADQFWAERIAHALDAQLGQLQALFHTD
jgi:hypothetical protein